ncbi:hypothetical protein [Aneurinibacillus sp. REN35]|uniref:hypothetical protein n=1 Tax=Aneurinibacillus sp. REN35 TaxID=3237286 RepID=UPI00352971A6
MAAKHRAGSAKIKKRVCAIMAELSGKDLLEMQALTLHYVVYRVVGVAFSYYQPILPG